MQFHQLKRREFTTLLGGAVALRSGIARALRELSARRRSGPIHRCALRNKRLICRTGPDGGFVQRALLLVLAVSCLVLPSRPD